MILHWLGIILGCLALAVPAEQVQSTVTEGKTKQTSRGQAECGKFQGWVGAENHKTKCHIAKERDLDHEPKIYNNFKKHKSKNR